MIIIVLVLCLEIHEVDQKQRSEQSCFYLKYICLYSLSLSLKFNPSHLYIKVKRETYSKVIRISKSLLPKACPLLGNDSDLPNVQIRLWVSLFLLPTCSPV